MEDALSLSIVARSATATLKHVGSGMTSIEAEAFFAFPSRQKQDKLGR